MAMFAAAAAIAACTSCQMAAHSARYSSYLDHTSARRISAYHDNDHQGNLHDEQYDANTEEDDNQDDA
jgi:hypothetical protein